MKIIWIFKECVKILISWGKVVVYTYIFLIWKITVKIKVNLPINIVFFGSVFEL